MLVPSSHLDSSVSWGRGTMCPPSSWALPVSWCQFSTLSSSQEQPLWWCAAPSLWDEMQFYLFQGIFPEGFAVAAWHLYSTWFVFIFAAMAVLVSKFPSGKYFWVWRDWWASVSLSSSPGSSCYSHIPRHPFSPLRAVSPCAGASSSPVLSAHMSDVLSCPCPQSPGLQLPCSWL